MEVALLLVRETDAVLARLLFLFGRALRDDVDLFVDLVIFLENVLLGGVESRFQGLEHLDHELRVLCILPTINVGVKVRPLNSLHVLFLHPEVYLEEVDEIGKEEAPIDVRLNMIGQLSHETNIDLRFDGIVLVICPVILKVAFKALGHLFGERAATIEVSKEAEPFRQVLTVLIVSCHILQVHKDIDELAHDVGETGDTNQQNESGHNSFDLTLWVIITETDSGQRGEGEIDHDD